MIGSVLVRASLSTLRMTATVRCGGRRLRSSYVDIMSRTTRILTKNNCSSHAIIITDRCGFTNAIGRLNVYHASGEQGGTAGAPSCLISFDKENTAVLERCGIDGKLVKL